MINSRMGVSLEVLLSPRVVGFLLSSQDGDGDVDCCDCLVGVHDMILEAPNF